MKSTLFSILSIALFATLNGVPVLAGALTIDTPLNVVQCQPIQLTFEGGQEPYFLTVHDGHNADGPALEDFGQLEASPFTWEKVNFASGTLLDLLIRDTNGLLAQSAPFLVNPGPDASCLNAGSSVASGASATTAAPSAAKTSVSSAASVTSPAATNGNKGTSSVSVTTAPAATSSGAKSSSSNAAVAAAGISYGAAGVLGAVVAAVLA